MNLKDAEARRKIAEDLDTNILVEAGAGSGKTFSLVKRMVSIVLNDKCPVENIAAVTFTRKAAAELKERFQNELEKEYHKTTEPLKKLQLNQALMNLDRCFTGTIHSFCAKLLKERPVEAGIDPEFEELDDVEESKLVNRGWQEYLLHVREITPELLEKIDETDVTHEELLSYFHELIKYPEVEIRLLNTIMPNFEPALEVLKALLEEAFILIPDPPHENRLSDLQKAILKARRLLTHLDMQHPINAVRVLSIFAKKIYNVQKLWVTKADGKDMKEKFDAFSDPVIAPLLEEWREYIHCHICCLLLPGREFMADYKNARSALGFHDLLNKSAAMLRDSPEAREFFQNKYRCLLVDEFQDTDPLQAELMFYLTGSDIHEKNWHELQPLPGSLFVVGDPKQSIYRFRRADIDTYNMAKTQIIKSGGEVLTLTTNFRCLKSLGEFCNDIFKDLLAEEENRYQALFAPVDACRDDAEDTDYGVRMLKLGDHLKNKNDIVAEDVRRISTFIRHAIEGNIRLDRTDDEKRAGLTANPQPRDFLILLRVKDMMEDYARALEEQGIPVTMTGGSSLSDSKELADLHKLLLCLNDPGNPVLMAAALKSFLFGVSDADLYNYKISGGSFNPLVPVPEEINLPSVTEAVTKIKLYLEWKSGYPPAVVLEKIIDDLGIVPLTLSRTLGERDCSYFYQVLEYVRQADLSSGNPFDAMVRQVEDLINSKLEEELELDPSGKDTVRLMNLHKAKGLEAPIVILANPGNRDDKKSDKIDKHIIRIDHKPVGYFAFFRRKGEHQKVKIAQPPGWGPLAEEELIYQQEEEKRLIYVAATRAKNLLVISTCANTMEKSPWKELLKNQDKIEPIIIPELLPPKKTEAKEAVQIDDIENLRDHLNTWKADYARPGYTKATPSGIPRPAKLPGPEGEEPEPEGLVVTAVAEEKEAKDKKAEELATGSLNEITGPGGAEWGTVMHIALETLVKDKPDIKEIILLALQQAKLSSDLVDTVLSQLEQFKKTDLWKDLQTAPEKYTEIPFSMHVDKEHPLHGMVKHETDSNLPVLLSGIIDLAYKTTEGWIIVDYKTDKAPDEEALKRLCEHYRSQVHIYACALEEITEEKVTEGNLFFVSAQQIRRVY